MLVFNGDIDTECDVKTWSFDLCFRH